MYSEKFAKLGYEQPLNMLFCLTRIFFPLLLLDFAWLILSLIFSCFPLIPVVCYALAGCLQKASIVIAERLYRIYYYLF